jgi:hypothetical protein
MSSKQYHSLPSKGEALNEKKISTHVPFLENRQQSGSVQKSFRKSDNSVGRNIGQHRQSSALQDRRRSAPKAIVEATPSAVGNSTTCYNEGDIMLMSSFFQQCVENISIHSKTRTASNRSLSVDEEAHKPIYGDATLNINEYFLDNELPCVAVGTAMFSVFVNSTSPPSDGETESDMDEFAIPVFTRKSSLINHRSSEQQSKLSSLQNARILTFETFLLAFYHILSLDSAGLVSFFFELLEVMTGSRGHITIEEFVKSMELLWDNKKFNITAIDVDAHSTESNGGRSIPTIEKSESKHEFTAASVSLVDDALSECMNHAIEKIKVLHNMRSLGRSRSSSVESVYSFTNKGKKKNSNSGTMTKQEMVTIASQYPILFSPLTQMQVSLRFCLGVYVFAYMYVFM